MIHEYLKNAHLTRAEFARRLGVTPQAVSRWVHGASVPRPGLMMTIAEITGDEIPVEYWLRRARAREVTK